MYRRDDPRFRRTLNQVTSTLESGAETAQIGLFSFAEHYVKPCLGSVQESLQPCFQSFQPCLASCAATLDPCVATCFPGARSNDRRGMGGRPRANTRGRLEHSFDFYDDWAEDENDALLALDDDEFDRVVGHEEQDGEREQYLDDPSFALTKQQQGQHPKKQRQQQQQPGRRKIFDYGAAAAVVSPRKSAGLPYDIGGAQDPTVIPNQSYFGFLSKLPFKLGQRPSLRYRPSAADLQVRSKAGEFREESGAGMIEEEEEETGAETWKGHGRKRSNTQDSRSTIDSYSSRGDLFPSDEEADAVPLDDEFVLPLERQRSGDDASSGRTRSSGGKRPLLSTRKPSRRKVSSSRSKSDSSTPKSEISDPEMGQLPTLEALKLEEQRAMEAEEDDVRKKRDAAHKLAVEKGLKEEAGTDAKPKLALSTSEIVEGSAIVSAQTTASNPESLNTLPSSKEPSSDKTRQIG